MSEIKILFAAMEDSPTRGGTIILRGVIDPADLHLIKYGEYQRELLPSSSRESIITAFKTGEQLPDVELGMRGQRYRVRGDDHVLQDDVFAVDGQQRIQTAIEYMAMHPQAKVRVGCCVHFDTAEAWERERFHVLNAKQKKVSPNVLLRNARDQHRPLAMLYGLSNQAGFVLHDRVCWQQYKQRTHLLTALICVKMATSLHRHLAPGLVGNSQKDLIAALSKVESITGIKGMRDNIGAYWNLIDECFGIRKIEYSKCAPHLNETFLATLARVLSNHSNFWRNDGKQLFIDADMRRKIGTFDLENEDVRRLCGAGGSSREILYELMVRHINSGKRTRALAPWADPSDSRKSQRSQAGGTDARAAPN